MKPREFWIFKQNDFDLGFERAMVAEYSHRDSLDGSEIHVIEYSAYEKLQARHEKLLEALEDVKANGRSTSCWTCNGNEPSWDVANEAIEADEKVSAEGDTNEVRIEE